MLSIYGASPSYFNLCCTPQCILLCSIAVHNAVELELASYTRKLDVSSSPFDSHGIAERHPVCLRLSMQQASCYTCAKSCPGFSISFLDMAALSRVGF